MKKSFLTIIILISGLFVASQLIVGCNSKKEQSSEEAADQMKSDTTNQMGNMKMDSTQTVFACPMHPEVTGKDGDKCSKCGMKLVAVKGADTTQHKH